MNPKKLLTYVNFSESVGWGMIRQLYDQLKESTDGTYIIAKVLHGTNQFVRLYRQKS